MKEAQSTDVFDTADFNPELILSSVFLDPGLDFVANIDDLGDNIMVPDILQHLGNSVFYSENTSSASNNTIGDLTADECHQQLLVHSQPQYQQKHEQQQQTPSQHASSNLPSRAQATVEKHATRMHYDVFESDYTKQLPSIVPLAMGGQPPPPPPPQQQQSTALGPAQQPCKCEFCEYLQANRISLTGDHSFQCEFCGQGFSNQTNFNQHRCGSTDIHSLYRCESCRREYGSSRALPSLDNADQRDKCDLCQRSYDQQSHPEGQTAYGTAQMALNTASTANFPASVGAADSKGSIQQQPGESALLPLTVGGSFSTGAGFAAAVVGSPDASNGSASALSAVNVQYIVDSPSRHTDLTNIDPFGSDGECMGDFFPPDATDATDATSTPPTLTGASSRTSSSDNLAPPDPVAAPPPPPLHHPEPGKTYFVLGNVDQLQPSQEGRTSNGSELPPPRVSNSFQHLHLPVLSVAHAQLPTALQSAPPSAPLPSEHEVTSLQQYDQYDDDDFSSMSEDEAIVPTEPYAKSPNQEHAKTELPIQETLVDTSTSVVPFANGSLGDGSTGRYLAQGTGSQDQYHHPPPPVQQQQQLLLQQSAAITLARLDNDEEGKCDSSSSSVRTFAAPGVARRPAESDSPLGSVSNSTIDRPYKCHICERSYRNQKNLKSHLKVHEGIRAYQCEICGKNFSGSSYLVIHRRRHTGERPFKCATCGKAFVDSRALAVHTRLHSGERLKCEKCEKTFSSVSALTVHNRLHTGIHPYKCELCGRTFPQYNNLKHHMKKHEASATLAGKESPPAVGGGVSTTSSPSAALVSPGCPEVVAGLRKPTQHHEATGQMVASSTTSSLFEYKCHICGKLHKSADDLQDHLNQHGKDRPNQCEFCSKVFPRSSHLIIHRRRHTGERPFKCKYCDKAFVDSRALSVHTRLHTGERVKCEICEKTFASSSGLIVHRRIHTGVHPYKCDYCEKTFAQSTALKYHLKKHGTALLPAAAASDAAGMPTGQDADPRAPAPGVPAPFQFAGASSSGGGSSDRHKCPVCNKHFRSSEYLVRHRRTHSGERPYQCEICGKKFSTMSYLVIHRRRHTSERPYKCSGCEKAFVDSRALQEHARLHTGDRVRCEICQKTYSSVSNLIVHRRIHSGIHPFECDSCGKSFAQKNALKYHLKKHVKPD